MDVTTLCLALGLVSANPTLSPLPEERVQLACQHLDTLVTEAEAEGFDPTVLAGLIYVESRWNPDAVSHSGACGLTQVIPRYVDETCNELKDPVTSIRIGTQSLKKWMTMRVRRDGRLVRVPRRGGVREALACYNAGYACSRNSTGRAYASAVLRHARRLSDAYQQLATRNQSVTPAPMQHLGYMPALEDTPTIMLNRPANPAEFYFPAWVPVWVETSVVTL